MGRDEAVELLPGTPGLLILKALVRGAMHGYGIAQHLKWVSDDVLQVGESSLYTALQRLLLEGWVKAEMGPFGKQPPRAPVRADRSRAPPACT